MLALNIGKNSRPVKFDGTTDPTKKPARSGCPGRESQRGSSTAPPIETYHRAQEWKNSTIWAGTFPDTPGITMSAAIPQHQFKTEIDMARSLAGQHQFCGGAADGIAMHADGAQAG